MRISSLLVLMCFFLSFLVCVFRNISIFSLFFFSFVFSCLFNFSEGEIATVWYTFTCLSRLWFNFLDVRAGMEGREGMVGGWRGGGDGVGG